jgi:hypothetical protein
LISSFLGKQAYTDLLVLFARDSSPPRALESNPVSRLQSPPALLRICLRRGGLE